MIVKGKYICRISENVYLRTTWRLRTAANHAYRTRARTPQLSSCRHILGVHHSRSGSHRSGHRKAQAPDCLHGNSRKFSCEAAVTYPVQARLPVPAITRMKDGDHRFLDSGMTPSFWLAPQSAVPTAHSTRPQITQRLIRSLWPLNVTKMRPACKRYMNVKTSSLSIHRRVAYLEPQEHHERASQVAHRAFGIIHIAVVACLSSTGGCRYGVAVCSNVVVHVVVTPDFPIDVAMSATSATTVFPVVSVAAGPDVASPTTRNLEHAL